MSTQVILLERVEKLGNMGDLVHVKPGYARNYLLPQKKALRASKENVAYFEAQKKHLEADNAKRKGEAEKLAKNLADIKAPLIRQASEAGQLYGSVASRDIAETVSEISKVDVQKSMVKLNRNLKTIGLFPIDIALHPEVTVSVTINIARTPEEAKIQADTGKALIAEAVEPEKTQDEQEAEALEAAEGVFEEKPESEDSEKEAAEDSAPKENKDA
jgi:large subunit ribosomal protein L9